MRNAVAPQITALFDGQVIESDNWKITVRKVFHQPDQIEPYGFRLETDEGEGEQAGVDDEESLAAADDARNAA